MKIKIFTFGVSLYFCIVSCINASQEIHETQKQSIRKQGIHIEYTNFESNVVIFDVIREGRIIKTIRHRITLEQKKELNKKIIEQFYANQFDTIKISKDNLCIHLPNNNKTTVSYNKGIFWCNSNLSLEQFSANLKNYLNKCLKGPTRELLRRTFQDRAALNPNIDPYENRGRTVSEFQPMMENCYVIGIHVPELKGIIDITEVPSENDRRNSVRNYQSTLTIKATANLLIYKLDNNEFVEYHNFENNNECQRPLIIKTDDIKETVDYEILNNNDPVFDTIFNELSVALGASSMRMSQCCFPIGIVVKKVEGTFFESRGVPDIRIDAPVYIKSRKDGEDVFTGWGKTLNVASSYGDPFQENSYRLISGTAAERDLGVVHPWLGIAGYVSLGYDESGGNIDSNEYYKKLQFGTYGDLGYVSNKKIFSEWWIEIGCSYGFSGEYFSDVETKIEFDAEYYALNFNIHKRLYLSPIGLYNIFVAPGAGVEYRRTSVSGKYLDKETDNFIAKAIVNVGYNFSPDHELFLSFAFNKVFEDSFANYEGKDKEFNENVADDSGLVIQIGYAFHFSVISGGFWNQQYNTTP